MFMPISPFGQRKRDVGLGWPAEAEGLTGLQCCVETVLADDIPGDVIDVECGAERPAS